MQLELELEHLEGWLLELEQQRQDAVEQEHEGGEQEQEAEKQEQENLHKCPSSSRLSVPVAPAFVPGLGRRAHVEHLAGSGWGAT